MRPLYIIVCMVWHRDMHTYARHEHNHRGRHPHKRSCSIAPVSPSAIYIPPAFAPLSCFSNPSTLPPSHFLSIFQFEEGYGQWLPHNYHKLTAPLLPPLLHAHQPCSLQPGSPRQHLRCRLWRTISSSGIYALAREHEAGSKRGETTQVCKENADWFNCSHMHVQRVQGVSIQVYC